MMDTEIIERPPRTIKEVFERLPEGTLAQLIGNNIVMSPSPAFSHQKVLDKIYRQLGNFVEKNKLGLTLVAPMDVYLDEENVFQPDILFISNEKQPLIEEDGIHGAPDLVIEILSPSTAHYDLGKKKELYELHGVREYWVVDPATKEVQGYSLKNNLFEELGKDDSIIRFHLLSADLEF